MTAATAELGLEDAFRAALASDAGMAPADSPAPPPPRRERTVDPAAPHGRTPDGAPIAPYGLKQDGTPRLKPAGPGRPKASPDDKPRTAKALPPAPSGTKAAEKPDYTAALSDLADGVWMLLSGVPVPVKNVRTRVHAQAAILAANKDSLVKAGNIAAQHHDGTAQLIEKLTTGNAAWALPCMFALVPFVGQSVAMWRAPLAGDVEALAAHNEDQFQAVLGAAMAQTAQDGEG